MSEIIVTTRAELCDIIAAQIDKALARYTARANPTLPDKVDVDGAVAYLNEIGCPISKHTLYALVAKEEVPHAKFGRRLVFSRKELTGWADSRTDKHRAHETRVRQAEVISQRLKRNTKH